MQLLNLFVNQFQLLVKIIHLICWVHLLIKILCCLTPIMLYLRDRVYQSCLLGLSDTIWDYLLLTLRPLLLNNLVFVELGHPLWLHHFGALSLNQLPSEFLALCEWVLIIGGNFTLVIVAIFQSFWVWFTVGSNKAFDTWVLPYRLLVQEHILRTLVVKAPLLVVLVDLWLIVILVDAINIFKIGIGEIWAELFILLTVAFCLSMQ